MKYFNSIFEIRRHYDEILENIDEPKRRPFLLESWGIALTEKDFLIEEREVLRYLIACELSIARVTNVNKPSLAVVERCFNRQLYFLEKIHGCHAYNVNKLTCKITQKEYKACRHYLFKFSLAGWYAKLPEEILAYENMYPTSESLEFEADLPIPSIN